MIVSTRLVLRGLIFTAKHVTCFCWWRCSPIATTLMVDESSVELASTTDIIGGSCHRDVMLAAAAVPNFIVVYHTVTACLSTKQVRRVLSIQSRLLQM